MTYRSPGPSVVVVAFGGQVFGLEASTGRRLWAHFAEKERGQNHLTRAIVHGGRVYCGPLDMELRVLELATGRLLSRAPMPHATGSTLLLAPAALYAAGNGAIACYSLDGALMWSSPPFEDAEASRAVSVAVEGYAAQGDSR